MVGLINESNLSVNDGPLTSENAAFLRPSDPNLPVEELRKRYDEDGYLLLKGVLPREDVLESRRRYFDYLAPTDVLEPGTQPVEGIFNKEKSIDDYPGIGAGQADGNGRPGGENAAQFVDRAIEAHYKDWYTEKLVNHPDLYKFIASFTGWGQDTLTFKRTLLRNNIPGSKPIGVHYDQIFLRYGEPTAVTAWVPMGDIKLNGGGLIYLQNGKYSVICWSDFVVYGVLIIVGDRVGQKIEEDFTNKAKQAGLTEEQARSAFNSNMMATGLLSEFPAEFARENNSRWLVSAYEAGDVVLHKPHMVRIFDPKHFDISG